MGIKGVLLQEYIETNTRKIIDELSLPQPQGIELRGNTLFIFDTNSSLRQELFMRKEILRSKLNESLGITLEDVKIFLRRSK